ncbi:hypothetical protein P153DRAFT_316672 [Dothidotthia symphoricarpi CBS 119687]|uniref:Sister chromatid cohesion protein n=1 Tax=Dothidotthia symphoricarpi CBS 119687 TaxID=1392245 RepID=A0A6A6ADE8_9PLEO|nr:uncharacterized protein P153DRAFT_316672 [Dothidotthia symphoricarpi CBS 119687]KAF2129576.1 hypothetical protein P153DRAFT_316672 [Dothidotthia symphoricarpi CBS 119687]
MAGYGNDHWHNGGGLPYRPPPTVDEAIPYSPFTSIVPFSPDIIPFPSAEPPTPPSTLTPDQRNAATKAISILNDEIKGQSTAQHLNNTLRQLQELLDPDELTQFEFKPMPQLVTPPPESPTKETKGSVSDYTSALSPFASLLLKQTNMSFTPLGVKTAERPRQYYVPPRKAAPPQPPRPVPQTQFASLNGIASTQNANLSHTLSAPPSASTKAPLVLIKSKSVRHEEYKRYDNVEVTESPSQKKVESGATALRPHEREIADRKIEELQSYVEGLSEEKDDMDASENFSRVSTADAEFNVLLPKAMNHLSDRISTVTNLGRFAVLPVDLVMQIQSLLEPAINSTSQLGLFPRDDEELNWSESLEKAKFALKASKLVLNTMIEGRDDYRMRREEIIDVIINLIKAIKDECIIPVVQSRRIGSSQNLFSTATGQRKDLLAVLTLCGSVFSHFATLIGKFNLSDRALNVMEYLSLELLVEQNSDSEKDSVFGIQKFEQFRQKAMNVIAQIFARHAEQRSSILNGILSNLEKLPDKKASARQFKSAREVPIMSISALFMRFIQVAAMNRETQKGASNDMHEEEVSDYEPGTSIPEKRKRGKGGRSPDQIAKELMANANQIAAHIAQSLIDRASNVSKTGDKPFRNLLDLFIEDFCNVLGSPEWPAAVLLIYQLLARMVSMLQGENATKVSVVDKDMALATMAKMGCGVIDFKHRLKQLKRGLDISQSDLSSKLDRLADDALNGVLHDMDLLAFDGPYRMLVESLNDYLEWQPGQEDPHLQSVSGCHVTLWLDSVIRAFSEQDTDAPRPQAAQHLQDRLESMIMDSKWLAREYKYQAVTEHQSKLAAGIVTLQSPVCKFIPRMVNTMLQYSRDKNSSKLRSRGMTGLEQLIEKDPRIIDEQTIKGMVGQFSDNSPMVRDHTLSLVSKCLEQDPSLERHFLPSILSLTLDTSNAPKKKAIKLLKDIYVGPTQQHNRLQIAASLLLPSQDDEKAIAELSRNVLEEIWLSSTTSSAKADENHLRLDRVQRASLMIDVTQKIHGSPMHLEAFEKFFLHALSSEAKAPTKNLQFCQNLVADMIDGVISPESMPGAKPQAHILSALSIFAKIRSTLFTMDQVQLLKLYIKDLATEEDLLLVQPTVTIFRHVFPNLPALQQAFAEEVRANLMRMISRLAMWAAQGQPTSRETLVHVAHCLWIVSPMADEGLTKLFATISSIICQIRPFTSLTKEQAMEKRIKIGSYLILLGTFGKVCTFDQYIDRFRERIVLQARNFISKQQATEKQMQPLLAGKSSAALLLLDSVRPFTMQTWGMDIREQALLSMGEICQQSPELFMRGEVEKVVKLVFVNQDNDQLKHVALTFFNEYFTFAERRSETGAEIAVGSGAVNGSARLETSFVANENDSATLHLAQKFLTDFVDVALKNKNQLAELATNIIASISRQGLVHPKECGAALVALGTSSNSKIAQTASLEHRRIHEKQESYLEKEYMQAVRLAFNYQRDIFNDPHGMVEEKYSPKLARLFEALKIGKKATIKRFVENVCKQIDFDLSKLKADGEIPDAILFARFCLENLSLLDFPRLEELAVFLNAVEAIIFKNTGPAVALAIETEMPKQFIGLEQPLPPSQEHFQHQFHHSADMNLAFPTSLTPAPIPSQIAQPTIDDARLRTITTACMILQMVWETRTFVRRCYTAKFSGRIPQKEYAKPAQRNNFISGKELWERLTPIMSALASREAMVKQCYDFADLLNVDSEAKVGNDEDDDETAFAAGYETPPDNGEASAPVPTSGRGRKRKNNVSLGNTPKKARSRPLGGAKGKKRSSRTPEGDDESE